jgi:Uma2 family endonuclease
VVEVLSPTSARTDRPPNGKKYQGDVQYGLRYYWLVDTQLPTVTTYERRQE